MPLTALDEELVVNGLVRASGGSTTDLLKKAFQFFGLTAPQQETQIRAEALLEYNEVNSDITNLQAKVIQQQAKATVLLNRSNGIQ